MKVTGSCTLWWATLGLLCVWLPPSDGLMLGFSELSREFLPLAQLPTRCLQPLSYMPPNCTQTPDAEYGTRVWYYDVDTQVCKSRQAYRGCINDNRFLSLEACDDQCTNNIECPTGCELVHDSSRRSLKRCSCPEEISQPICSHPVDEGKCQKSSVQSVDRFYFDAEQRACHSFPFSRCNGNSNNFGSSLKCRDICMYDPDYVPSQSNLYIKILIICLFVIISLYFFRDTEFRHRVRNSVVTDVTRFISSHKKNM